MAKRFKMATPSGVSVVMTVDDHGDLAFMWTPRPSVVRPYTAAQIRDIDAMFIDWVGKCLRG